MGPLVAEHGPLTLDPADDAFARLVVSIVRQQVSTDAAAAIRERVFDAVTVAPAKVLAADPEALREAGLSGQKVRYVRAAAEAFRDHPERYARETLAEQSNDEVRERLTEITGVGRWTADMQLLFTLGRPDVFPVGDLGVRRGVERLVDAELSRAEIRERARRWAPYRSYASLHLWANED
ncbi:DNA-3-methyladenine glycosylase [Halobaculum sp. MBLA0143]|uniref:DNA-3-methyladenine glycosylase family protein n=1 Tax=Halobaculum sp. MBLA0143 TaxID=3079933 RepID=UPI003525455D